ncbi:outer membrane beta-barrel protein [Hymenobacter psychrophilus]|uniref:Outer membrane protein beta-barrel domain-containing protein n=1 Tax=Hymenobacter psychrophilus TaxID=651662 RepID=A0A1H3FM59_9BACT|nr:outer membrane beta-barrel protein [Hymenobacter psychrophilus]SDX92020.1 Outer membrane protein beta-barrel domain-containing protein [Hymenobacter psychrophilus]
MLKKLLLVSLLGISCQAAAQTNFRPGYVVTLGGDTLRGEVDARGAVRNARLARFRPTPDAAITDYRPGQLQGYAVTGEHLYQRATVLLADSLGPGAALGATPDTVQRVSFVEVLVRGPLHLLYLRDEQRIDHYYAQLGAQPLHELRQRVVKLEREGRLYQQQTNEFRRTLAELMTSCPSVQPRLNTLRYQSNELVRAVQAYNVCVGESAVLLPAAARRTYLQLGLVTGAEVSHLKIAGNPFKLPIKGTSAIGPVVGVGLTLHTGLSRNVTFRLEALYERQKYNRLVPYGDDPQASSTANPEKYATLSTLRAPLLVRYTYPKGRLRPMVYAGFTLGFFLQADVEDIVNVPRPPLSPLELAYNLKTEPEQAFTGGLGLTTARPNGRNASVELRYEYSNGFNALTDLNRFYLLLSYDLTK